jgi:AraC-like DNA-binding protein
MSRLLNLHRAAGEFATTVPDILAHPEVARAMEQELLHVMVRCLADGPAVKTEGSSRGLPVMRLFEQFLEANPDSAVHLPEVCAAIGVSDRTLRSYCQEHLGLSPRKYLWLRRMHLARKALASADPSTTTVTVVATDYGFWELGRFATQYRGLFGESPSGTLRRLPNNQPSRLARSQTSRGTGNFASVVAA